jgi:hypothetical protein
MTTHYIAAEPDRSSRAVDDSDRVVRPAVERAADGGEHAAVIASDLNDSPGGDDRDMTALSQRTADAPARP